VSERANKKREGEREGGREGGRAYLDLPIESVDSPRVLVPKENVGDGMGDIEEGREGGREGGLTLTFPSRGLIRPGYSSPKEMWEMEWETLKKGASEGMNWWMWRPS